MGTPTPLVDTLCLDDRIVPVQSGIYLHAGAMDRVETTAAYRHAVDAPPVDAVTRVFLDPSDLELASDLFKPFLDNLPQLARDRMLINLSGAGVPVDNALAQRFADRFGLRVELDAAQVADPGSPLVSEVMPGRWAVAPLTPELAALVDEPPVEQLLAQVPEPSGVHLGPPPTGSRAPALRPPAAEQWVPSMAELAQLLADPNTDRMENAASAERIVQQLPDRWNAPGLMALLYEIGDSVDPARPGRETYLAPPSYGNLARLAEDLGRLAVERWFTGGKMPGISFIALTPDGSTPDRLPVTQLAEMLRQELTDLVVPRALGPDASPEVVDEIVRDITIGADWSQVKQSAAADDDRYLVMGVRIEDWQSLLLPDDTVRATDTVLSDAFRRMWSGFAPGGTVEVPPAMATGMQQLIDTATMGWNAAAAPHLHGDLAPLSLTVTPNPKARWIRWQGGAQPAALREPDVWSGAVTHLELNHVRSDLTGQAHDSVRPLFAENETGPRHRLNASTTTQLYRLAHYIAHSTGLPDGTGLQPHEFSVVTYAIGGDPGTPLDRAGQDLADEAARMLHREVLRQLTVLERDGNPRNLTVTFTPATIGSLVPGPAGSGAPRFGVAVAYKGISTQPVAEINLPGSLLAVPHNQPTVRMTFASGQPDLLDDASRTRMDRFARIVADEAIRRMRAREEMPRLSFVSYTSIAYDAGPEWPAVPASSPNAKQVTTVRASMAEALTEALVVALRTEFGDRTLAEDDPRVQRVLREIGMGPGGTEQLRLSPAEKKLTTAGGDTPWWPLPVDIRFSNVTLPNRVGDPARLPRDESSNPNSRPGSPATEDPGHVHRLDYNSPWRTSTVSALENGWWHVPPHKLVRGVDERIARLGPGFGDAAGYVATVDNDRITRFANVSDRTHYPSVSGAAAHNSFSVLRAELEPGRFVKIYRPKLYLRRDPDVSRSTQNRIVEVVRESLAAINERFRLPNGDQFHFALEFVDRPEDADRVVRVTKNPLRRNTVAAADNWPASVLDRAGAGLIRTVFLHELLHLLQLDDEYLTRSQHFQAIFRSLVEGPLAEVRVERPGHGQLMGNTFLRGTPEQLRLLDPIRLLSVRHLYEVERMQLAASGPVPTLPFDAYTRAAVHEPPAEPTGLSAVRDALSRFTFGLTGHLEDPAEQPSGLHLGGPSSAAAAQPKRLEDVLPRPNSRPLHGNNWWTPGKLQVTLQIDRATRAVSIAERDAPAFHRMLAALVQTAAQRHRDGGDMPAVSFGDGSSNPMINQLASRFLVDTFTGALTGDPMRRALGLDAPQPPRQEPRFPGSPEEREALRQAAEAARTARETAETQTAEQVRQVGARVKISPTLRQTPAPKLGSQPSASLVQSLPVTLTVTEWLPRLDGDSPGEYADDAMRQAMHQLWDGFAPNLEIVGPTGRVAMIGDAVQQRLDALNDRARAFGLPKLATVDVTRTAGTGTGMRWNPNVGGDDELNEPRMWDRDSVAHLALNTAGGAPQPTTVRQLKDVAWLIATTRNPDGSLPASTGDIPHTFTVLTYAIGGAPDAAHADAGRQHAERVAALLEHEVRELLTMQVEHGIARTLAVTAKSATLGQLFPGDADAGPARWGVAIAYTGPGTEAVPPHLTPHGSISTGEQRPLVRLTFERARALSPEKLDGASRERLEWFINRLVQSTMVRLAQPQQEWPKVALVNRLPAGDPAAKARTAQVETLVKELTALAFRRQIAGTDAGRAMSVNQLDAAARMLAGRIVIGSGDLPWQAPDRPLLAGPRSSPVPLDIWFQNVDIAPRDVSRAPALEFLNPWRVASAEAPDPIWWRMPLGRAVADVPNFLNTYSTFLRDKFRDVTIAPTRPMANRNAGLTKPALADGSHESTFGVLRAEVEPGKFVRVHRVRVFLRTQPGVALSVPFQLQQLARQAAAEANHRWRTADGDQFHLDLDFVTDPRQATHTVLVTPDAVMPGVLATSNNWPASLLNLAPNIRVAVLLHELMHLLGLPDEYPSNTDAWVAPNRFTYSGEMSPARSPRPVNTDLMGNAWSQDPNVRAADLLAPRYMWKIPYLVNDKVGTLPALSHDTIRNAPKPIFSLPPSTPGFTGLGISMGGSIWSSPMTLPSGASSRYPVAEMDLDAPEPVRVEGGHNAGFAQLARRQFEIGPEVYQDFGKRLTDARRPIAFVVNTTVPAAQVSRIPQFVEAVLNGLAEGTRVAFVIGVNSQRDQPDARLYSAVAEAMNLVSGIDAPIAVVGHAVGSLDNDFPYGRARNAVLNSPENVAAIQGVAGHNYYPYVAFQDFDAGSRITPTGRHVFDQFAYMAEFDPDGTLGMVEVDSDDETAEPRPVRPARPMMFAGGYRIGDTDALVEGVRARIQARINNLRRKRPRTHDGSNPLADAQAALAKLDRPEQFLADFGRAMRQDMAARDEQAKIHPLLPYSPETGLIVDGLLLLGDPELRFGDGNAEFTHLAERMQEAYGRELATSLGAPTPAALDETTRTGDLQVAAQNYTHRSRGRAFIPAYQQGSTPTDLVRIASTFALEGWVPQSHANLNPVANRFYAERGTQLYRYENSLRTNAVRQDPTTPYRQPPGTAPQPDWRTSMPAGQQRNLGADPANRLNPTISTPGPGDDDRVGDPDPMAPARGIGLAAGQRLIGGHLLAATTLPARIAQEFADALATLTRDAPALDPRSIYHAVAAQLDETDPEGLRTTTLRTHRDQYQLMRLTEIRTDTPYEYGHFVTAALAPVPAGGARSRDVDADEVVKLGSAHDVVAQALARALKTTIVVHTDGIAREFDPVGAKPRGTLHVSRVIDERGQAVYRPGVDLRRSPRVEVDHGMELDRAMPAPGGTAPAGARSLDDLVDATAYARALDDRAWAAPGVLRLELTVDPAATDGVRPATADRRLSRFVAALADLAVERHRAGGPMPALRFTGEYSSTRDLDAAAAGYLRDLIRTELPAELERALGDAATPELVRRIAAAVDVADAVQRDAGMYRRHPVTGPTRVNVRVTADNWHAPVPTAAPTFAPDAMRQGLRRLWDGFAAVGEVPGDTPATTLNAVRDAAADLNDRAAALGLDGFVDLRVQAFDGAAADTLRWTANQRVTALSTPQVWHAGVTHLELRTAGGGLLPSTLDQLRTLAGLAAIQHDVTRTRPESPDGVPHGFAVVSYAVGGRPSDVDAATGARYAELAAETFLRELRALLTEQVTQGVARTLAVTTRTATLGHVLGADGGPTRWGIAIRYTGPVDAAVPPHLTPGGSLGTGEPRPLVRLTFDADGRLDHDSLMRLDTFAERVAGTLRRGERPYLSLRPFETGDRALDDARAAAVTGYLRAATHDAIVTATLQWARNRGKAMTPDEAIRAADGKMRNFTVTEAPPERWPAPKRPSTVHPDSHPVPFDLHFGGVHLDPGNDRETPPLLDYLNPWRTSRVRPGAAGWWQVPADALVTDVDVRLRSVAALAPEATRAVDFSVDEPHVNASAGLGVRSLVTVPMRHRYDVTRVEFAPGKVVRAFHQRIYLERVDDVSRVIENDLKKMALEAVADINHRFRLPNGDQFHLTLEFVDDPAKATNTVRLSKRPLAAGALASHDNWPGTLSGLPAARARLILLHELMHLMGLDDEYISRTQKFLQPFRNDRGPGYGYRARRVDRTDLMGVIGDYGPNVAYPRARDLLMPRYLHALDRVLTNAVGAPVRPFAPPPAESTRDVTLEPGQNVLDVHTQHVPDLQHLTGVNVEQIDPATVARRVSQLPDTWTAPGKMRMFFTARPTVALDPTSVGRMARVAEELAVLAVERFRTGGPRTSVSLTAYTPDGTAPGAAVVTHMVDTLRTELREVTVPRALGADATPERVDAVLERITLPDAWQEAVAVRMPADSPFLPFTLQIDGWQQAVLPAAPDAAATTVLTDGFRRLWSGIPAAGTALVPQAAVPQVRQRFDTLTDRWRAKADEYGLTYERGPFALKVQPAPTGSQMRWATNRQQEKLLQPYLWSEEATHVQLHQVDGDLQPATIETINRLVHFAVQDLGDEDIASPGGVPQELVVLTYAVGGADGADNAGRELAAKAAAMLEKGIRRRLSLLQRGDTPRDLIVTTKADTLGTLVPGAPGSAQRWGMAVVYKRSGDLPAPPHLAPGGRIAPGTSRPIVRLTFDTAAPTGVDPESERRIDAFARTVAASAIRHDRAGTPMPVLEFVGHSSPAYPAVDGRPAIPATTPDERQLTAAHDRLRETVREALAAQLGVAQAHPEVTRLLDAIGMRREWTVEPLRLSATQQREHAGDGRPPAWPLPVDVRFRNVDRADPTAGHTDPLADNATRTGERHLPADPTAPPKLEYLSPWRTDTTSVAGNGWWTLPRERTSFEVGQQLRRIGPVLGADLAARVRTVELARDRTYVQTSANPLLAPLAHSTNSSRYDVVRIETEPGRFTKVFRPRLHIVRGAGVNGATERRILGLVQEVVNLVNHRFRLPGGDQFHFAPILVPERAQADRVVNVTAEALKEGVLASADNWPASMLRLPRGVVKTVLLHELLHLLGLDDEYFARTTNYASTFKQLVRDALAELRITRPGHDQLMGNRWQLGTPEQLANLDPVRLMASRHLFEIERLQVAEIRDLPTVPYSDYRAAVDRSAAPANSGGVFSSMRSLLYPLLPPSGQYVTALEFDDAPGERMEAWGDFISALRTRSLPSVLAESDGPESLDRGTWHAPGTVEVTLRVDLRSGTPQVRLHDGDDSRVARLVADLSRSAAQNLANGGPDLSVRMVTPDPDYLPADRAAAAFLHTLVTKELRGAAMDRALGPDADPAEATRAAGKVTVGSTPVRTGMQSGRERTPRRPVDVTVRLTVDAAHGSTPQQPADFAEEVLRQQLHRLWHGFSPSSVVVGDRRSAAQAAITAQVDALRARAAAVGIPQLAEFRSGTGFGSGALATQYYSNERERDLVRPQAWAKGRATNLELDVAGGGLQPQTLDQLRNYAWFVATQEAPTGGLPGSPDLLPHQFTVVAYAVGGAAHDGLEQAGRDYAEQAARYLERQIRENLTRQADRGVPRDLIVTTESAMLGHILHTGQNGPPRWGLAIAYKGVGSTPAPAHLAPQGRPATGQQEPTLRFTFDGDALDAESARRLSAFAKQVAKSVDLPTTVPALSVVGYDTDRYKTSPARLTAVRETLVRELTGPLTEAIEAYAARENLPVTGDEVPRAVARIIQATGLTDPVPNQAWTLPAVARKERGPAPASVVPVDIRFSGVNLFADPAATPIRLDYASEWRTNTADPTKNGWWSLPPERAVTNIDPARLSELLKRHAVPVRSSRQRAHVYDGEDIAEPLLRQHSLTQRYDLARLELKPGTVVRVHHLRLHLKAGAGASKEAVDELKALAETAVAQVNGRFLTPDGDQFHIALDFTDDPAEAMRVIDVPQQMAKAGTYANSGTWPVSLTGRPAGLRLTVLLHEIVHLLGLYDEYIPQGQTLIDVFRHVTEPNLTDLRNPRPGNDALMGNAYTAASEQEQANLRPEALFSPRYVFAIRQSQQGTVPALRAVPHAEVKTPETTGVHLGTTDGQQLPTRTGGSGFRDGWTTLTAGQGSSTPVAPRAEAPTVGAAAEAQNRPVVGREFRYLTQGQWLRMDALHLDAVVPEDGSTFFPALITTVGRAELADLTGLSTVDESTLRNLFADHLAAHTADYAEALGGIEPHVAVNVLRATGPDPERIVDLLPRLATDRLNLGIRVLRPAGLVDAHPRDGRRTVTLIRNEGPTHFLATRPDPPSVPQRAVGTVPQAEAALRALLDALRTSTPEARVTAVRRFFDGVPQDVATGLATNVPDLVGNLEGAPYPLRFAANQQRIAARAARTSNPAVRDAMRKLLEGVETWVVGPDGEPGRRMVPRQILTFDPAWPGRVVEVRGDLATAGRVGVLVPGMLGGLNRYPTLVASADNVRNLAGPGQTATIAWLGYRSPQHADAMTVAAAKEGGALLREFRAGLQAELAPGATVTVSAHSYGTLVTSYALRDGTPFDNVVLMGSPGIGTNIRSAADLGLAPGSRLYTARAPGDAVSYVGYHGPDPATFADAFRFGTAGGKKDASGHVSYYAPGTRSLTNVGHVVAGRHGDVTPAETTVPQQVPGRSNAARFNDFTSGISSWWNRSTTPAAPASPAPPTGRGTPAFGRPVLATSQGTGVPSTAPAPDARESVHDQLTALDGTGGNPLVVQAISAAFEHLRHGRRDLADAAIATVAKELDDPAAKALWVGRVIQIMDSRSDRQTQSVLHTVSEMVVHCRFLPASQQPPQS
ncbi:hypothetical protein Val02_45250 [Virgisporangium aliadipatigenens]|uniref:DUF1023 domain-containing protein n=1 Tax=Virgisporangium aliadipatigenens TaxID=741659 RepID=A0A8J3YLE3_9ACTN|nr:alpha/beta hydrolase [Virgisporangium aliadipatigenens]GIJ47639.1 hypothetical protein Val02_45250 [Virgisporangium aliadipatigenens]